MATNIALNIFYMFKIINMAMVRIFNILSYKFNAVEIYNKRQR
jgi:hypothetical protein